MRALFCCILGCIVWSTVRGLTEDSCGPGTQLNDAGSLCVVAPVTDSPLIATRDGNMEITIHGARWTMEALPTSGYLTSDGDVACAGEHVQIVDGLCQPLVEAVAVGDTSFRIADIVDHDQLDEAVDAAVNTINQHVDEEIASQATPLVQSVNQISSSVTAIESAVTAVDNDLASEVTRATTAEQGLASNAEDLQQALDTATARLDDIEALLSRHDEWITATNESLAESARDGLSEAGAARSCLTIKANNPSADTGIYFIQNNGDPAGGTIRVHCNMDVNGGGWTMIAYAGRINGNKRNTVGGNYQMLFHTFQDYDANAHASRNAFSQLKNDAFRHIFVNGGQFLAYRTAVRCKQMIWPIASSSAWRGNSLPAIPYLRFSRDCTNYVDRRPIQIFGNGRSGHYIGYDWNSPCSNCDRRGSYSSGMDHRCLLYWEVQDDGYASNQWFHADPLNLDHSRSPDNSVQDIAFYIRESDPS